MTDQKSSSIAACCGVKWAMLVDAVATCSHKADTVAELSVARPRDLPARFRKLRRVKSLNDDKDLVTENASLFLLGLRRTNPKTRTRNGF